MEPEPKGREPLFNAPWPALVVVASILLSFAWESATGLDAAIEALGFSPADLDYGRWPRIVTVMFVHADWVHAISNAVAALAFGAPVARTLGGGARGPLLFFVFYFVCGALSSLSFAALHPHGAAVGVGASGAISGLMGAASRMLGPRRGPLSPVVSPVPLSIGAGWILTNAILALTGVTPFEPGVKMLWEAHIGGFVAGLLLIGWFVRLAAPLDREAGDRAPSDRGDVT